MSCIKWSPNDDILLVTSWDGSAGLYRDKMLKRFKLNVPILCGSWNKNGSQIVVGACDNNAYLWDIQTEQKRVCAQHQASIKFCRWIDQKILITISWDQKLKYWDVMKNNSKPEISIDLSQKVYCMDYNNGILALGCADGRIRIYDIRNPFNVLKELETTLKHQFRTCALFPKNEGLVIGSIEGRVYVKTFNNVAKTFAYKCHRNNEIIFPVHCIKFHQLGTFVTTGGDGSIVFWDKDNKQKLKTLNPLQLPVIDADFSRKYNMLAYASSYDWSKGKSKYQKQCQVFIRQVQSGDVQRKNT